MFSYLATVATGHGVGGEGTTGNRRSALLLRDEHMILISNQHTEQRAHDVFVSAEPEKSCHFVSETNQLV